MVLNNSNHLLSLIISIQEFGKSLVGHFSLIVSHAFIVVCQLGWLRLENQSNSKVVHSCGWQVGSRFVSTWTSPGVFLSAFMSWKLVFPRRSGTTDGGSTCSAFYDLSAKSRIVTCDTLCWLQKPTLTHCRKKLVKSINHQGYFGGWLPQPPFCW